MSEYLFQSSPHPESKVMKHEAITELTQHSRHVADVPFETEGALISIQMRSRKDFLCTSTHTSIVLM